MDKNNNQDRKDVFFAGIDVGSTTTKMVLLDFEKKIRVSSIIPTGPIIKKTVDKIINICFEKNLNKIDDIKYCVATGYGREMVDLADEQITEITCHAKGVNVIFPQAKMIIDVGGQDSKVISVDGNGNVLSFVMNDKCAAGTGRFLEVIARSLELSIDEMAILSRQSKKKVEVSSMCTVFAESEVISLVSQGVEVSDIAAAINRSIARRLVGLVQRVGLNPPVVMTGGVAQNKGVVKAIEDALNIDILISTEPQLTGALGAAHIALQRFQERSDSIE
jgi:predicted CoA-substrate-specific enzyme activase